MNKWIWVVIIAVILLIAGYVFTSQKSIQDSGSDEEQIDEGIGTSELNEQAATNLQTSEDDFAALDEALEGLE